MTGILFLDPATVCGWAFARPGEAPIFGSLRMGPVNGGVGPAVAAMRAFLLDKIGNLDPDLIGYESPYIPIPRQPRVIPSGFTIPTGKGPPPMNAETVFKLAAFAGTIEAEAYEHAIRCVSLTPPQIAKFFTGSGRWGSRAEKKAATIRMCEHFGYVVKDDNAADAIAGLMCVESLYAPRAAAKRGAGPLFSAVSR